MTSNLSPEEFVSPSLELNLFFLRIMKEHAIFLAAGFPAKDKSFIQRAGRFKNDFSALLRETIAMANGNIGQPVLDSGELVTRRTVDAECKTTELTGIAIDPALSAAELELTAGSPDAGMEDRVREFNDQVLALLQSFIDFQKAIQKDVLACRLFNWNFPSMLEHLIREADHYREHLEQLQAGTLLDPWLGIVDEKVFWDDIMAEHAQYIAHYLDPAEMDLIKKAHQMAEAMMKLEARARELVDTHKSAEIQKLVADEIAAVSELREFKQTGEEGILDCRVRSLIVPLMADHVYREANHFLRLLEAAKMPAAGSKPKTNPKTAAKPRKRKK